MFGTHFHWVQKHLLPIQLKWSLVDIFIWFEEKIENHNVVS